MKTNVVQHVLKIIISIWHLTLDMWHISLLSIDMKTNIQTFLVHSTCLTFSHFFNKIKKMPGGILSTRGNFTSYSMILWHLSQIEYACFGLSSTPQYEQSRSCVTFTLKSESPLSTDCKPTVLCCTTAYFVSSLQVLSSEHGTWREPNLPLSLHYTEHDTPEPAFVTWLPPDPIPSDTVLWCPGVTVTTDHGATDRQ